MANSLHGHTFTKMPARDGSAMARPLLELVALAKISLIVGEGGGGGRLGGGGFGERLGGGARKASVLGVLNCSMLPPLVIRPLLSTPTTVTLYCVEGKQKEGIGG